MSDAVWLLVLKGLALSYGIVLGACVLNLVVATRNCVRDL